METDALIVLVLFGTKKKEGMFCKCEIIVETRRHEMSVVREAVLHLPARSLARAPTLSLY